MTHVRRILLASALASLALVAVAAPTWAAESRNDPADCPVAALGPGDITFAEIEPARLPPQLRSYDYDCGFDVDGLAEAEALAGAGTKYVLVSDGGSFADFQALLRAFAADPEWEPLFPSLNLSPDSSVTLDELLALDTAPAASIGFQRQFPEGFYIVTLDFVDDESRAGNYPYYYSTLPAPTGIEDYSLTIDNSRGSFVLVSVAESGAVEFPTSGFDASTPSVLSGLTTVREALTPPRVAFAAGGTIVLGLLMTFPSRLLSSAKDRIVERAKPRALSWWRRFREEKLGMKPAAEKPPREVARFAGWPLAVGGLLLASILTVFIDPRAGFDLGTLRLFGSVFVAFLLDVGIGWLGLTLLVSRLVPTAVPYFKFKPWTFLVVVGAVLFTRLTAFEPGLAVGIVAGVVFGGVLAHAAKARLTLAVLGYAFALSIVAWFVYSALVASGPAEGEPWLLFVQETLAAITVAGIVALPLALIPVRGLVGYEIFSWSRRAWAIAYAVGLVGFLLVIVPLPSSWKEVPVSFVAWLGLFALYALAAVAVWLFVYKPWVPEPADDQARRASSEVSPPTR